MSDFFSRLKRLEEVAFSPSGAAVYRDFERRWLAGDTESAALVTRLAVLTGTRDTWRLIVGDDPMRRVLLPPKGTDERSVLVRRLTDRWHRWANENNAGDVPGFSVIRIRKVNRSIDGTSRGPNQLKIVSNATGAS